MARKSQLQRLLESTRLAFPVLGLALGGSWLADGLMPITQGELPNATALILGLAIFFGSAHCLYINRHNYLPIRLLSKSDRVEPHQALIVPVSSTGDPEGWRKLPDDLDKAIETNDRSINWLQILRTLYPHRNSVKEIHLIGSNGEKGSFAQLDECQTCIQHYFPNAKVIKYPEGIPFEDIDAVTRAVNDLIGTLKPRIPTHQIMLDATGGTKTMSIAMAMTTLDQPELQFQYVTTDEKPRPIAFNVVAEQKVELG